MFIAFYWNSQVIGNDQTDEWTSKLWYIHMLEYYSIIKRMNDAHNNMDNLKNPLSNKLGKKWVQTALFYLYNIPENSNKSNGQKQNSGCLETRI